MYICTHDIYDSDNQLAFIQGRSYELIDITNKGRAFLDESDAYYLIGFETEESKYFEEL